MKDDLKEISVKIGTEIIRKGFFRNMFRSRIDKRIKEVSEMVEKRVDQIFIKAENLVNIAVAPFKEAVTELKDIKKSINEGISTIKSLSETLKKLPK